MTGSRRRLPLRVDEHGGGVGGELELLVGGRLRRGARQQERGGEQHEHAPRRREGAVGERAQVDQRLVGASAWRTNSASSTTPAMPGTSTFAGDRDRQVSG